MRQRDERPVQRYCYSLLVVCILVRPQAAPQMKSASYLLPLTTHLQVALLGLVRQRKMGLFSLVVWRSPHNLLVVGLPAKEGNGPIMLCNPSAEAWLAAKACLVWASLTAGQISFPAPLGFTPCPLVSVAIEIPVLLYF